jgi:hypothetical protein
MIDTTCDRIKITPHCLTGRLARAEVMLRHLFDLPRCAEYRFLPIQCLNDRHAGSATPRVWFVLFQDTHETSQCGEKSDLVNRKAKCAPVTQHTREAVLQWDILALDADLVSVLIATQEAGYETTPSRSRVKSSMAQSIIIS